MQPVYLAVEEEGCVIELSDAASASWRANRYVHVPGAFAPEIAELRRWADELADWPEDVHGMKYFEATESERQTLCRVENFLPVHPGLRDLFRRPDLLALLEGLLGEPAVLFKEKINYKLPGGDGFRAHQDAPAFAMFGQRYHVTAMVSVDATTPENGCLEVVNGHGDSAPLQQAEDGTLAPEVVAALDWKPLPTAPGDLLVFDSYLPHRSGPNRSSASRRAYYVTYNRASDGDRRDDYFALKREAFPPESERGEGDDSGAPHPAARYFNLGNPIR